MSDSQDIKARLEAALNRIETAAAGLGPVGSGDEAAPADGNLQAELDAEKTANAQLEERVRAIKDRQESLVARLEQEVAELKIALATRDTAVRHVRQTNGKLRQANRALRQANAQGVADPDLINQSMTAELEALRALQSADRAELDDVLSSLDPIVGEVANA
jgi:chromosome segregation ATPase